MRVVQLAGRTLLSRSYPHRAWNGLYHGVQKQSGFKEGRRFGNKTRRCWNPNVHRRKKLYSQILGRFVRFNVTSKALKYIDGAGGLDNYILRTPDHIMKSKVGEQFRRILQKVLKNNKKKARRTNARKQNDLSEASQAEAVKSDESLDDHKDEESVESGDEASVTNDPVKA